MLVLVDTNFPELVDPRSESLAYDKLQETLDGFFLEQFLILQCNCIQQISF